MVVVQRFLRDEAYKSENSHVSSDNKSGNGKHLFSAESTGQQLIKISKTALTIKKSFQ